MYSVLNFIILYSHNLLNRDHTRSQGTRGPEGPGGPGVQGTRGQGYSGVQRGLGVHGYKTGAPPPRIFSKNLLVKLQ